MPSLRPGQPAPDATLQLLDGRSVSLSTYWRNGRSLLLIFLRHLA
ncbi:MAG TPA: hypothetical protein PLD25_29685 [Chloroflexota bacterium]|nr:hypothetical protein [Chloroflexota bacterium]HUM67259.1 hypothetical protein [Chloroflexota bacterium]